ncbi:proprotein convertase subtilisin/kexin type 4 [Pontoporia blainvillei]|uniref:Proprotein convertase subtilisin/kexin type 4 n=1 Tax=Pontoporia blainvillei TaxID=48723 RepID=A0ABX0S5Z6_PONBL|nr:proprotein convertase subtilisin/kexin type 4 [Pontoporia blainvillei]
MLAGTITDVIEAQSLSLQPQHIHIYSASWGSEDDGRTVDGPGILTREAFRRGVTKGRGGLGTLFIWASGNGGLHYDNCNCDGYTNSIHTLSVGSTTQQGRVPWHSALHTHHYLQQRRCCQPPNPPRPILRVMHVRKNVSACVGRTNYIRSLEHVQVQLSLSYSRRGDLEISLTSPMGTRSTVVAIRPFDVSGQGYNNWIFMSTHFWDEDPHSLWTLVLENKGYYFNTGTLYRYTLLLYGTAEDMTARPSGPQVTSSACVQRDAEGPCQECQSPTYILGHLCLTYCPPRCFNHTQQAVTQAEPGRPAAPALRVCSSCHPSCYTCRGSSPLDCTACPPPSMLDAQRGSCSGPDRPEGPHQPTATACPCRHSPARAVVLALLAVAFVSPLLCRVLLVGCPPPWVGPPRVGPPPERGATPITTPDPAASWNPELVDKDSQRAPPPRSLVGTGLSRQVPCGSLPREGPGCHRGRGPGAAMWDPAPRTWQVQVKEGEREREREREREMSRCTVWVGRG